MYNNLLPYNKATSSLLLLLIIRLALAYAAGVLLTRILSGGHGLCLHVLKLPAVVDTTTTTTCTKTKISDRIGQDRTGEKERKLKL